jgi:hypothetical protein
MSKSGQIIIPYGDAPMTPNSGKITIYADNNKVPYYKDDEGNAYQLAPSGIVTAHNELTGLSADDHPQYHNDVRGDARYYTQAQVDAFITSVSGNPAFIELTDTPNTYPSHNNNILRATSSGMEYYVMDSSCRVVNVSSSIGSSLGDGSFIFPLDTIGNAIQHIKDVGVSGTIYMIQLFPGNYYADSITVDTPLLRSIIGLDNKATYIKPNSSTSNSFFNISSVTSLSNLTIDATDYPSLITSSGSIGINVLDDSYEQLDFDNVIIKGFRTGFYTNVESNTYMNDCDIRQTGTAIKIGAGALFDVDNIFIEDCWDKHVHVFGAAEAYLADAEMCSTNTLSGTGLYVEGDSTYVEIFGGTNIWGCNKNLLVKDTATVRVDNCVLEESESYPCIEQKNDATLIIINSRAPLSSDSLLVEDSTNVYINSYDFDNELTTIGKSTKNNQPLFSVATGSPNNPYLYYEHNHDDVYSALGFVVPTTGSGSELFATSTNGPAAIAAHSIGDSAWSNECSLKLIGVQGGVKRGWCVKKLSGATPQIAIQNADGTNAFYANYDGSITLMSGVAINSVLDEDDFASDSAVAVATQQSINALVSTTSGSINSDIIVNTNNIAINTANITTVSNTVDTNATNIATNTSNININTDSISTNVDDITTLSGLIDFFSDHGNLYGRSDDDHPQYHNDTRGDTRYYTQPQVDNYIAGVSVASGISYTNSNWAISDVQDALYKLTYYIENSQGTGRISPDVAITISGGYGSSDLLIYEGSGYINHNGVHKYISWEDEVIDFTGYAQGLYYIYVDTNGDILTSQTDPGLVQVILLGFCYYTSIALGLAQSCGGIIEDSINRTLQYMYNLGVFLTSDEGLIQLMDGYTNRIVSPACTAQFGMLEVDMPEIDSDDAATLFNFYCIYTSVDEELEGLDYFSNPVGYNGAIFTDRWNDITASGSISLSGTYTFTQYSNVVTVSGTVSDLEVDDFLWFGPDTGTYVTPIAAISGSNVILESIYAGPGGTGQAYASRALPRVPDGKWLKHLIGRTLDGSLVMLPSQTYFDTEEDAIAAGSPLIPSVLERSNVKMSYVVCYGNSTDISDGLIDIRPLPFHLREGTGQSGGTATDHGALIGLSDDDHTQYVLANGNRNFTSKVQYASHPSFTVDTDIVDKKYVDDSISGYTNDHGDLSGLNDDDHPQYHNNARGDDRYYTQNQVDNISGTLNTKIDNCYTEAETDALLSDKVSYEFGVNTISGTGEIHAGSFHGNGSNITGITHDSLSGVTSDQHHNRSHSMTSTSDHSAGNWSLFYSDGSGNINELPIGDSGEVLTSSGTSNTPYWAPCQSSDVPTVQVRRSSNYTLTTGWADIVFDITDVENDSSVLEHDTVNTQRVNIKESGLYMFTYNVSIDADALADTFSFRILANGDTVVSGSLRSVSEDDETTAVSVTCFSTMSASDYVTFQGITSGDTNLLLSDSTYTVVRAKGAKGDQGEPGSGSTLVVKDENVNVTNTPHSALNFVGPSVSVADSGSGIATVTISAASGGIAVSDEGTPVSGGPFTTLDFTGQMVTATDAGSNVATIDIPYPVFGSWYGWGGDSSESYTNSTSWVNKVSVSVSTVPAGYYRIGWYFEWRLNNVNYDFRSRIQVDNTDTIMSINVESKDSNSYHPVSGFAIVEFASEASHFIDVDYSVEAGFTSGYIRNVRIEYWRVA